MKGLFHFILAGGERVSGKNFEFFEERIMNMDDKLNTAYATVSRAKAIAEKVVAESGGGTQPW